MVFNLKSLVAAATILLGGSATAATLSITTGVDNNGTKLAAGSLDSDWEISVRGGAFKTAKVLYPSQICCNMETVSPGAWLSDQSVVPGSSATGWGIGHNAILRTTFDLSGIDISTASLTGVFRVADYRQGVFLNGNLIPGSGGGGAGYNSNISLGLVTSGFLAGINTLEMRASSGNSMWDGFWFDGKVNYEPAPVVPLPAGLPLLLTGFGVFALIRRRIAVS